MEAIILSRRDFREYDQMISVYTKEKGRLDLLARGVKKITSKNSSHLEPFTYGHIEIAHGKEVDHLLTIVPIDFFSVIRQDLAKSLAAGFIVSFLRTLIEVGESDTLLFTKTKQWLHFLEKDEFRPLLVDAYVLIVLARLGFTPTLEVCVACGKKFHDMIADDLARPREAPPLRPGFYFAGGGIVCATCREKKNTAGETVMVCGLKEVSNMQMLMKGDWHLVLAADPPPEEVATLHRLVYEYTLYHSERKIADWAFFESV